MNFVPAQVWMPVAMVSVPTALVLSTYVTYIIFVNPQEDFNNVAIPQRFPPFFKNISEFQNEITKAPVYRSEWSGRNQSCSLCCRKMNSTPPSDKFFPHEMNPMPSGERQYIYHGCCITYKEIISPRRLKNKEGEWRKLIQFKEKRQLFRVDVCRHFEECEMPCRCMQQVVYEVAVVVDDDGKNEKASLDDIDEMFEDARLEFVVFPGTCKCFNTRDRWAQNKTKKPTDFIPHPSIDGINYINIDIVNQDGGISPFNFRANSPFRRLMQAYCLRMDNLEGHKLLFKYNGNPIQREDTPETLGMEDGDSIEVTQISGSGIMAWTC